MRGSLLAISACVLAFVAFPVRAFGPLTDVRIGTVMVGRDAPPLPEAARRLTWEVRQRTSIETSPPPPPVRLDDPRLFDTPFVYWRGESAFPPLSEPEIVGLRRFLEFGGFLLVDDAAPQGNDGFDQSVRRMLRRTLPAAALASLPSSHVIYRSFFLVDRPLGRRLGPGALEHIALAERVAVVYSRHDLGGAWARDNLGNWLHPVEPGGERQRERAIRLGVNLMMYAVCLDYKDDQVHAPYIMRRRPGSRP